MWNNQAFIHGCVIIQVLNIYWGTCIAGIIAYWYFKDDVYDILKSLTTNTGKLADNVKQQAISTDQLANENIKLERFTWPNY